MNIVGDADVTSMGRGGCPAIGSVGMANYRASQAVPEESLFFSGSVDMASHRPCSEMRS